MYPEKTDACTVSGYHAGPFLVEGGDLGTRLL